MTKPVSDASPPPFDTVGKLVEMLAAERKARYQTNQEWRNAEADVDRLKIELKKANTHFRVLDDEIERLRAELRVRRNMASKLELANHRADKLSGRNEKLSHQLNVTLAMLSKTKRTAFKRRFAAELGT